MENLPVDRLEPKGELCTITCYVDADHARDKLTTPLVDQEGRKENSRLHLGDATP